MRGCLWGAQGGGGFNPLVSIISLGEKTKACGARFHSINRACCVGCHLHDLSAEKRRCLYLLEQVLEFGCILR